MQPWANSWQSSLAMLDVREVADVVAAAEPFWRMEWLSCPLCLEDRGRFSIIVDPLAPNGFWAHSDCRVHSDLQLHRYVRMRLGHGKFRPTSSLQSDFERAPREFESRSPAYRIWEESAASQGTPVEAYLTSLGVELPPKSVLRFNKSLKHPAGSSIPAMVALISDEARDVSIGVHCTFLRRKGDGWEAADRMRIGGRVRGVVKLAESSYPPIPLLIGVRIETALKAMFACGLPAWAGLSEENVAGLRLDTDFDIHFACEPGTVSSASVARCVSRWRRQGRRVQVKDFSPPRPDPRVQAEIARLDAEIPF